MVGLVVVVVGKRSVVRSGRGSRVRDRGGLDSGGHICGVVGVVLWSVFERRVLGIGLLGVVVGCTLR